MTVPDSVLYIDPQASYRTVFREFLGYSEDKIALTPRLNGVVKSLVGLILGVVRLFVSPQKIKK